MNKKQDKNNAQNFLTHLKIYLDEYQSTCAAAEKKLEKDLEPIIGKVSKRTSITLYNKALPLGAIKGHDYIYDREESDSGKQTEWEKSPIKASIIISMNWENPKTNNKPTTSLYTNIVFQFKKSKKSYYDKIDFWSSFQKTNNQSFFSKKDFVKKGNDTIWKLILKTDHHDTFYDIFSIHSEEIIFRNDKDHTILKDLRKITKEVNNVYKLYESAVGVFQEK